MARGTWARLVFETRGWEEEFSFLSGSTIAATEAAGAHCRQGTKRPANKRRKGRARRRREVLVERIRNSSSQPGSKTAAEAAMAPAAVGAAITPPSATGTGVVPTSLPAVARADAVRGEATAKTISPAAAAGTTAAVEKAHLNAIRNVEIPLAHRNIEAIKREVHEDMCKKLAVISVDLIKNQSITASVLAKAQQSDDLLAPLRENIHTDAVRSKGYVIKIKSCTRLINFRFLTYTSMRYAYHYILLPSVIHHLHVMLGHPAYSSMLKNFRIYYHNPAAQHLIKKNVESCTTCALATKYNIKKITPSVDRTMKPTRPRQYLYADLIPMFKGTFSYILFALDAYSQYVYAIPLKDKTAASVLQGFLAIFGTTGWYENNYLDNETSFVKVAKMLVKIAPIQVH